MKPSLYDRLENIVAVIVCVIMLILFGVLWYSGVLPFSDFKLSVIITIVGTVGNVGATWLAVKLFVPKTKRRRKHR